MDYLNRKKLIEALKQHCDDVLHTKVSSHTKIIYSLAFSHCIDRIKIETPADVAPVARGMWIHEKDPDWRGGGYTKCSVCNYGYADGAYLDVEDFNYCPHCGAKMENEA